MKLIAIEFPVHLADSKDAYGSFLELIGILSQPNPTPTQQQLNLTQLRLDLIITPNPPHHPTPPHKLSVVVVVESKSAVGTVVTAWRQHYISLM